MSELNQGSVMGVSESPAPRDRLLVAHARLREWRLAISDAVLLDHLAESDRVEV